MRVKNCACTWLESVFKRAWDSLNPEAMNPGLHNCPVGINIMSVYVDELDNKPKLYLNCFLKHIYLALMIPVKCQGRCKYFVYVGAIKFSIKWQDCSLCEGSCIVNTQLNSQISHTEQGMKKERCIIRNDIHWLNNLFL